jgi:predicted transcriptional regulator
MGGTNMNNWRLGIVEASFADLIWNNAPISSGALAKLAAEKIGWKKTTTYTVLKRLCDRGIFQNDGGTVMTLIGREEFYARQSEEYVQESFAGSLPAFLVAFGSRKKLTDREIDELQRVIDDMRRG